MGMDRWDILIVLGCVLIAAAVFWVFGWPGVLAYFGMLLVVSGLMGAARSEK